MLDIFPLSLNSTPPSPLSPSLSITFLTFPLSHSPPPKVHVSKISVLNVAVSPLPFYPGREERGEEVSEDVRLKYRYLDLRRAQLQQNIRTRAKVPSHSFIFRFATHTLPRAHVYAHAPILKFTQTPAPLFTITHKRALRLFASVTPHLFFPFIPASLSFRYAVR